MQIIKEKINKIKTVGDNLVENSGVFTTIMVVLVAFSSFGLGRLSVTEENKIPISVINSNQASITQPNKELSSSTTQMIGKYVASVNSDKYHAPWCSGAQRIKESNKIWFETKEEAEASGRTPASNCKGI